MSIVTKTERVKDAMRERERQTNLMKESTAAYATNNSS